MNNIYQEICCIIVDVMNAKNLYNNNNNDISPICTTTRRNENLINLNS
jgi:hypothetical protein